MEYKIIKEKVDGNEVCFLDITEEFVKRFGKCFSPIERVAILLGGEDETEFDSESLEMLYKGIFSLPDSASILDDYITRVVTYGNDALLYGMNINIIFQNKEVLDISSELMEAGSISEKEIQKETPAELEIRKVAFAYGMHGDYMLILTDAPKSAIENWAREYNKGLEDNNNVYFNPLQKYYYVKIIGDSEVNNLTREDIDIIGFAPASQFDRRYGYPVYFNRCIQVIVIFRIALTLQ